ncbi:PilT/PilU family type 4a pilus ATPase [Candidatus Sumerlaeota bacterium]|nr:PilT/PilU family type 4a pilus ATPase [Candidatus Sumerlaeota bacterium]
MLDLRALVQLCVKQKASDIHLGEGVPPYLRIDGILRPVTHPPIDHDTMLETFHSMGGDERMSARLEERRGVDFAWQPIPEVRYRVVAYYERNHMRITMRAIPTTIPTIEELDMPEVIRTVSEFPRGLVLVTGMTGSGKSTTLAAMLDHVNRTEPDCIITIEDPIEFVHENKKSTISQREVGKDVTDFLSGLVQAMRQDPDVILIGEMRDPETMKVALHGAETGHLVLSTLHTTNATHTIERIIANFPETEHELIRDMLATNLRAAIGQRLVRRAGGKGRIAAFEVMVCNATVQKLIRENRIHEVGAVIKGREAGMQTYDQALADLVNANKITMEEAVAECDDEFAFKRAVKGVSASGDKGGIIAGF